METFGKTFVIIGQLLGAAAWLGSAAWLFASGQDGLALLALLVPPADLVLVFLTPLWSVAIAAIACFLVGFLTMATGSTRATAKA